MIIGSDPSRTFTRRAPICKSPIAGAGEKRFRAIVRRIAVKGLERHSRWRGRGRGRWRGRRGRRRGRRGRRRGRRRWGRRRWRAPRRRRRDSQQGCGSGQSESKHTIDTRHRRRDTRRRQICNQRERAGVVARVGVGAAGVGVDERVRTHVRTHQGRLGIASGSIGPGVCTPCRTCLVCKLLDAIAESHAVAKTTHGHEYDQSSAVVRIQTLSRAAAIARRAHLPHGRGARARLDVRLEENLAVVREAALGPFGADCIREAANEAPVGYGGASVLPSHLGVDVVIVDEAALPPIRSGDRVEREAGKVAVALGNARHGRRAVRALGRRAAVIPPGHSNDRAGLHAAGNRCDVGGVTRACRRRRKA